MKVFFYIESCYKGVKCIQVFQMLHIFRVKVGFSLGQWIELETA